MSTASPNRLSGGTTTSAQTMSSNSPSATTEYSWNKGTPTTPQHSWKHNLLFMLGALGILGLGAAITQMFNGGLDGLISSTAHSGSTTAIQSGLHLFHRGGKDATAEDIRPYMYRYESSSAVTSQADNDTPTFASDSKLPEVWSMVWQNAGWTPMKLMVDRALKLQQYSDLVQHIQNSTLLADSTKQTLYKYIGMASVGGGWISHGDVFPLHPTIGHQKLPNHGQLTCYGGGSDHVGSLQSGTEAEWIRVAQILLTHAELKFAPDNWSEHIALLELGDSVTIFDEVHEVTQPAAMGEDLDGQTYWMWNPETDCTETLSKRAVHFRVDPNESLGGKLTNPAGDMVVKWLSMFLQSCDRPEEDPFAVENMTPDDINSNNMAAAMATRSAEDPPDDYDEEVIEAPHPEAIQPLGVEPPPAQEETTEEIEELSAAVDAAIEEATEVAADPTAIQPAGVEPPNNPNDIVINEPESIVEEELEEVMEAIVADTGDGDVIVDGNNPPAATAEQPVILVPDGSVVDASPPQVDAAAMPPPPFDNDTPIVVGVEEPAPADREVPPLQQQAVPALPAAGDVPISDHPDMHEHDRGLALELKPQGTNTKYLRKGVLGHLLED